LAKDFYSQFLKLVMTRDRSRSFLMRKNVALTIVAIGIDSLAQGVWLENILPVYLYLILGNSNTKVDIIAS